MSYVAIAIAILLFCWSLRTLGLVPASLEVVSTARRAAAVIKAPDLSDREKEAQTRAAAIRLFVLFGTIALKTVVALAVPVLAIVLLGLTDIVAMPDVIEASMSWPVIAASTIAAALVLWR
jgi:hypothetical protein